MFSWSELTSMCCHLSSDLIHKQNWMPKLVTPEDVAKKLINCSCSIPRGSPTSIHRVHGMSKPNVGAVGVHGQLQGGIISHLPLVAVQVPPVQGASILQVEAGDQRLHLTHCAIYDVYTLCRGTHCIFICFYNFYICIHICPICLIGNSPNSQNCVPRLPKSASNLPILHHVSCSVTILPFRPHTRSQIVPTFLHTSWTSSEMPSNTFSVKSSTPW